MPRGVERALERRVCAHPGRDVASGPPLDVPPISLGGAHTVVGPRTTGSKITERERIEARLMEYADAAAAAVAAGSQQRLISYKTSIGNVFQCPRCWVEKAEQRRASPTRARRS
jgi:hypothetical protein